MAETKGVCAVDPAVPYERGSEMCPHCGMTAREHWFARGVERAERVSRQEAIAAAEREVVRTAKVLASEILAAPDGDGWLIGQYAYGDMAAFAYAIETLAELEGK